MIKAVALEGQSLLDLALQECGSIEAAFDMAVQNGLSVTSELTSGQLLESQQYWHLECTIITTRIALGRLRLI